MSQSYMNEVLRPVVLHFHSQNQCKKDDNARIYLARISKLFFHQNNVVRIDWLVGSSDMSTIEHVKDILDIGSNTALRNIQVLDAALQEESRLIFFVPIHQNYAKPMQVLICG